MLPKENRVRRPTHIAGCMLVVLTLAGVSIAADPAVEVLGQKIEANYWNCFLSEILSRLEDQYGLRSAYPSTVDKFGVFNIQESSIAIKALLEKVAADGKLELEYKSGKVLFWKKADDALLKDLEKQLQAADRWIRC